MYFQQDTVLRMIEMLGTVYRYLMGLLDDLEARGQLDNAYRRFCGLDRSNAEGMSVAVLADMLTPERLVALSELTYIRAQRFGEKMEPEALEALYARALMLLCQVNVEEIAKLRLGRAQELLGQCQNSLEPDCAEQLLRFFVLGGGYGAAEDALFNGLEQWPQDNPPLPWLEAGLAMYAGLLNRPDADLALGNLPRLEVQQGLAELRERYGR